MFRKHVNAWLALVFSLTLIASGSYAQAQTLPPAGNGDTDIPFWDFTSLTVLAEEGISLEVTEEIFEARVEIQSNSELPDFGYFAYSVPSLDGQYLRLVEGEVVPWSDQIRFSSTTLMRAPEELSGDGSETFTDGNRTFFAVASASGTTDEWVWWECTKAGLCGLGQGAVNIVNGVQDTVIGVANIPAAAVNGIAWIEEQLGILDSDDPIRVPYIPSPDWSKDLIVEEDDFSHGVSKFSGAAGVEILTGVWIAKIAKAHRVTGLIDDLVEAGVKVTPDDVLKIAKRSDDTIIFLEKGNDSAGLTHIINRHADDFVRAGIPEERIADIVFEAAVNGTKVGTQGTRPIYEIVVNGKKIRVVVTVGDNGFIVGANPVSF